VVRSGLLLIALASACDPAPTPSAAASGSPSTAAPAAPSWPAVITIGWDDAVKLLRDKGAITAIPTAGGRVHLTTPSGMRVTTAPDDTALAKLLDEIDPKHTQIGTTDHYVANRELDWAAAQAILRGGEVNWIEDNGQGRLLVMMADEPRSQYVTYAPPGTDVAALVEAIGQRPLYIRYFRSREIGWAEAERLIREKSVEVSCMHGRRVAIRTNRKVELIVYEPTQDAALKLIEEVDPKREMLLSVE